MANLLEQHGARPSNKEPKFVPLFVDRAFTGLFTQRAALHDPSDLGTLKFYGGRPDSLWMGSNIELTNRLTLQRRPGLSPFSTVTYPTAPDRVFDFELINGTIRVIVDTGSTGNLSLTSVVMSSGSSAIYIGTFPFGGSNAYAGMIFQVSGFLTAGNNGTFVCLASTTTTLTLTNPQATPETDPAIAISAGAVYFDEQNGNKILLFGKSPNAGQTHFVAVGGVLYMGDGVDTNKYTPLNTNGTIWNWGIVVPAKQPGVVITPSGSAAISWQANTVWSTMGLIYVTSGTGNGSVQQLINTNALGTNVTPQFNTTGSGGPNWNQNPGGTTPGDGTITWTNYGPIDTWHAHKLYSNGAVGGTLVAPAYVWDSVTQGLYVNGNPSNANGTSGSQYPHFIKILNTVTSDNGGAGNGGINWFWTGDTHVWQPTHAYPLFNNVSNTFIVEPLGLGTVGPPSSPPIFVQGSSGGTSGTGGPPSFSTISTNTTADAVDGSMTWMSLGLYTWTALHQVSAWTSDGSPFSVIRDTNGNFQVCTTTGQTGSSQPTWATVYGSHTADGTAVWVCVGVAMQWAANTIWFRPTPGFSPPSSSSPYGGASVVDSNGDVEFVINSGKGGAVQPIWNGIGATTTDGAATWFNTGVVQAQSLSWLFGLVYAYSFKARSLTDFYTVPVTGTSTPPVPPGLTNPLPFPTGSETNAISTASPVFIITGANAGAVNTISGFGSTDPQVDTIVIWRSADGGGPSNMFELTEIPAPLPINGQAQPWSFKDFLPSTPTATFPGLNILIPAPINHSNDPPNSTFLPMVYNFTRIWGAEGQQVNFSGGPDVVTGNPNEAFNPSDELPFLANVINIVKNTQGLVTFLTDSIQLISGGPQTASFFSVELCPNVGLLSFNELDVHAGEIYFLSADNQFYAISPSLNLSRVGFPIGDQLANMPSSGVSDTVWNSAVGYVAVHQSGIDNCIMIADGVTGWYRVNPYQTPGGYQGPEPIWSPFANITNGCKMVQSIQIAPGIKKLLVGTLAIGGSGVVTSGIINFGTANTYGVLAGTTVANTGATTINGDLGLNPGSAVTGAPTVTGTTNVDNVAAIQAKADLATAYSEAAGLPGTILIGSDLGGTTLTPGVYSSQSGSFSITSGDLTLDAQGNANVVWVFQTQTTLTVAGSRSVLLANGALARNVFWQIGTFATIGASAIFNGTIAASNSITTSSGATVNGGLWSQNGAVTMNASIITAPSKLPGSGSQIVVPGPVTGYQIMFRDLTKFTDNGIQYGAYFVMGSIMLVHPGQLAVLKFLEMDYSGKQFRPIVSFLLNEIAGNFTVFPTPPQADPPSIYGTTGIPQSYSPNRYYFSTTKQLARCRHLQIRVDYGKTAIGDELYNATIFGRLLAEF